MFYINEEYMRALVLDWGRYCADIMVNSQWPHLH